MSLLTWSEKYSVGVERIDKEHKVLIDMINKAYISVEEMEEDSIMEELAAGMLKYALSHFATEEALMREYGYPDAKAHLKMHDDFISRAAAVGAMAGGGQKPDPIKMFKYLADWLRGHILGTDRKLAEFLNGKGVS